MPKPTLLILVHAHQDPIWKRCFKRPIREHGFTHVSYEQLEQYYIDDCLAMCRRDRGFKFHIECPAVLRNYIEQHPQRLPELRRLVKAGRLLIKGAGDNIIDTNLVTGESIVRNFVTGLLWVEKTFGVETHLATRLDGFGNSAQLPQILRGCELPWVTGFSYYPVYKRFWRGLDGSCVCAASLRIVGSPGRCEGHAMPCPKCHGRGCAACHHRGIADRKVPLPEWVHEQMLTEDGAALLVFGSEEPVPNPAIVDWARNWPRDRSNRYDVRFALETETQPYIQRWLDQVDQPPQDEVQEGELNPVDTGVLVSRIRCKQTCRRQEYALLSAESLAAMATLAGAPAPSEALAAAWRDLLFTQFHDAVTGTHTDAPHRELQTVWRRIDRQTQSIRTRALRPLTHAKRGTVSAINPLGNRASQLVTVRVPGRYTNVTLNDGREDAPVVDVRPAGRGQTDVSFVARDLAPLSARTWSITPGKQAPALRRLDQPIIENHRFRVTADEHGIASIYEKKLGRELAATSPYRPGEFIIERDFGSPWSTLSPDQARFGLSGDTRLVAAEAQGAVQRLVFRTPSKFHDVRFYGFVIDGMEVETTVTLIEGIDRVDFRAEVLWDTYAHRLRVAFPVQGSGRHFYEIPGGVLQREPYKPDLSARPEMDGWHRADGDWPTTNWAGVQLPTHSVALLNKGLPSYQIERGAEADTILLSVLRSPNCPTHLACPQAVTTDFDGMRDAGRHSFEFSLVAYDGPFAASSVIDDAEGYNAGFVGVAGTAKLPEAPAIVGGGAVRIGAFKRAEIGNAFIVRLVEHAGNSATVTVRLPEWVAAAARVNLLERQAQPLSITNREVSLPLRPWEIATLRLAVRANKA